METFVAALKKCGKYHMYLFFCAFDYYEIRLSTHQLNDIFNQCCKDRPDGNRDLIRIPKVVYNYCVHYVAGRCEPIKEKIAGEEWKENG